MSIERQTKYTKAVQELIGGLGHATNAELLTKLRDYFPELSATTVHRVTARLQQSELIAFGPPAKDGSFRYDANLKPHDHFCCDGCGGVRDIKLSQISIDEIESQLDGCKVNGRVVIKGSCSKCITGGKQ